jgi:hypothetical protein
MFRKSGVLGLPGFTVYVKGSSAVELELVICTTWDAGVPPPR